MKENVYAFIDSQNLNLGVNTLGWKLDFSKFRLYLKNKYNVTKAYLFIGYIPENAQLYRQLQESGYILIFKNVLAIKKGSKLTYKGNVDAELVLHAMIHYSHYDRAIIISGDGDFFCLVEYLAKNNKLSKVIAPNYKYSSLLRKYAKFITSLSSDKLALRKNKKERNSRSVETLG